ncbi:MAG: MarR family winged helix-turn-helix transcriptional regulator [Acidimicrobiales bacterium]
MVSISRSTGPTGTDRLRSGAKGQDVTGARRAGQVGLGAALRRAWLGYQRRLDRAMAEAGFGAREFPDGRVLRLCSEPGGTTISDIGRQLGITRQGAGKAVGNLRERGYVSVAASATSGREKTVRLTPRAEEYLAARRRAARTIERQLRRELGDEAFVGLGQLLEALGGDEDRRMSAALREARARHAPTEPR